MKYIIVGLGNFGASIGQKLTAQGNEVIAIDTSMSKVEMNKERISHTICMDATDEYTVRGLPLRDTDVVIIAIGEDERANIMSTALFKNLNVKRLISRAINPLHEKVLQALGIHEIVHPEEESAERWAKKLSLNEVVDSFELGDKFSIIEAKVPKECVGSTHEEVGFRRNYNIILLTTIKNREVKSLLGKTKMEANVQGVATPELILEEDDILVLFGANKDLQKFLKMKNIE